VPRSLVGTLRRPDTTCELRRAVSFRRSDPRVGSEIPGMGRMALHARSLGNISSRHRLRFCTHRSCRAASATGK